MLQKVSGKVWFAFKSVGKGQAHPFSRRRHIYIYILPIELPIELHIESPIELPIVLPIVLAYCIAWIAYCIVSAKR